MTASSALDLVDGRTPTAGAWSGRPSGTSTERYSNAYVRLEPPLGHRRRSWWSVPDVLPLHPVNRGHLEVLSDEIGVMQHANGSHPDPAHGYCTDDVARALQVDLLHERELGWPAVAESAWRNVRFVTEALDRSTGRFRNFRRVDGTWLDGSGSEDCHGRAMLALGETIAAAPDPDLERAARRLFADALPAALRLRALRARASVLLGCDTAQRAAPTPATRDACCLLAERLRSSFDSRSSTDWLWPESALTYENALPARALLVAGRTLDSELTVAFGIKLIDWLIDGQTGATGHLSPIGNGWWPAGGERSRFDQQPIEATALLLAAETAHEHTNDPAYLVAIERAYGWFLGANDVGVAVAAPERGASYDGLTGVGVNANQGAESTLMWLIALEHVRAIRAARPVPLSVPDGAMATSTA